MSSRIRVTVEGKQFTAVLNDTSLTKQIIAMCLAGLTFARGGDREYYAHLPKRIKHDEELPLYKCEKNKLYYFEGWNALSVAIKDCDTFPYQIYEIGSFEDDIAEALSRAESFVYMPYELID